MSVVDFAIRDAGGTVSYGSASEHSSFLIALSPSAKVSLNLSPADVTSYAQRGNDLIVVLADGQEIILQNYFSGGDQTADLFLSENGVIQQVELGSPNEDEYPATYQTLGSQEKWGPYDDLVFLDLQHIEPVVAPLAAPLLGGLGAAGAVAAAGIGGALLLPGGGGSGGDTDTSVTLTIPIAGDDIANAAEVDAGVALTGTAEPGATVTVKIGEVTHTVTAAEDGGWSTTFKPEEIPEGTYETDVVVTATDDAGNTDTTTATIKIDTEAAATLNGPVEGDNVVNASEASDGVTLTGTADPGSSVAVTLGQVTHTVTADKDGNWSANFAATDIPAGTYDADVTVTATDVAGNVATATGTVRVDTETTSGLNTPISGDGVISGGEAAAGVTLTGTAEAGASVAVTMGGTTHTVTADSDGNWSATFAASEISSGTYDAEVTVVATDTAGNTSTSNGSVRIDTETATTLNSPVEGDNVVNASEASDGVTLKGTAEAGSSVVVTLHGVSQTVTAGSDGNWSADFSAAQITSGSYDADVTVTATDAAGNTSSTSGTVRIDTETNAGLSTPIAGDNVINASEASGGVTLTGTAEAGASVAVTLGGVKQTVTAGSNGTWSATFDSSQITTGTHQADVLVEATDTAGNTATTSATVQIDTETTVSLDGPIEGDNIINAAEASDGVTLTGVAEAGAQVTVVLKGVSKVVTAGSDGKWSAGYSSADIGTGEFDAAISVTSQDGAGNTATASGTVRVDTSTTATIELDASLSDTTVNAVENQSGVTLGGTAEAGSKIVVEVQGREFETTTGADGKWSVTLPDGAFNEGTYVETVTVTATDLAGNSSTATADINVDTEVTNPVVEAVTFSDDKVTAIALQQTDETYEFSALHANGSSTDMSYTKVSLVPGEDTYAFGASPVPDGSHLVVQAEDAAGNQSDTLVVLDDNATNAGTLDHAALGNFDIEAIELDYASNVELTLTEAQIAGLSDRSDTLTVHGDSEDQVTLTGAVKTNQTQEIDGETYDVYTIGDDGVSLVVDQDVNVII